MSLVVNTYPSVYGFFDKSVYKDLKQDLELNSGEKLKRLVAIFAKAIPHAFMEQKPDVCYKILKLMGAAVGKNSLNKDVAAQAIDQFIQNFVFKNARIQPKDEKLQIKCEDGKVVRINKDIAIIRSDYIENALKYKSEPEIDFSEGYSQAVIEEFKSYLYTNKISKSIAIDTLFKLLDLAHMSLIQDLKEDCCSAIEKWISKIGSLEDLENFLKASELLGDIEDLETDWREFAAFEQYLDASKIKFLNGEAARQVLLNPNDWALQQQVDKDVPRFKAVLPKYVKGCYISEDEHLEPALLLFLMKEEMLRNLKIMKITQYFPVKEILDVIQGVPNIKTVELLLPMRTVTGNHFIDYARVKEIIDAKTNNAEYIFKMSDDVANRVVIFVLTEQIVEQLKAWPSIYMEGFDVRLLAADSVPVGLRGSLIEEARLLPIFEEVNTGSIDGE